EHRPDDPHVNSWSNPDPGTKSGPPPGYDSPAARAPTSGDVPDGHPAAARQGPLADSSRPGPGLPVGVVRGPQQRFVAPPGHRPTAGPKAVLVRHGPVRLHHREGLLGPSRLAVRPVFV